LEKSHIEHILSEDPKFNLDKILARLSSSVFKFDEDPDTDKEYKRILSIIAEKGPLTEYKIGKYTEKYGLNRDAVRRRILGTSTLLSLYEKEFVFEADSRPLNFKKQKKISKEFGLTLKGLLSSLTYAKFEDSYLMKIFRGNIEGFCNNKQYVPDFSIQYVKFDLAIILSWHAAYGIDLTNQENIGRYLRARKIPVNLDYPEFIESMDGMEKETSEIQYRYIVLGYVLSFLVGKMDKDSTFYTQDYVLDWSWQFERLHLDLGDVFNPFEPHVTLYGSEATEAYRNTIKTRIRKTLKNLNFKNPDISKLKHVSAT